MRDGHLESTPVKLVSDHGWITGSAGNAYTLDGESLIGMPNHGFIVTDVLVDEGKRGQGHGQDLYLLAIKHYGRVYSTFPTSPEAMRVHDTLVRKGLVTKSTVETADGEDIFSVLEPTPAGKKAAKSIQ